MLEKTHISKGKKADPAALLMVIYQLRSLLRFHQRMGLTGYPGRAGLEKLFRSGKSVGVVSSSPGSKNKKTTRATTAILQKTKTASRPLSLIQREIEKCSRCPLAENRLGQVVGNNPQRAKLMVVGDWSHQADREDEFSPRILMGREEDTMLWKMMNAIGVDRERVFVTNVVKCCPTGADIGGEPVRLCSDHLEREISSVQPKIILAMGKVAAYALVDAEAPVVSLRGRFYPCRRPGCKSILVMVSFHPSFLAGKADMKKMTWEDLQMVQQQLSIS